MVLPHEARSIVFSFCGLVLWRLLTRSDRKIISGGVSQSVGDRQLLSCCERAEGVECILEPLECRLVQRSQAVLRETRKLLSNACSSCIKHSICVLIEKSREVAG